MCYSRCIEHGLRRRALYADGTANSWSTHGSGGLIDENTTLIHQFPTLSH